MPQAFQLRQQVDPSDQFLSSDTAEAAGPITMHRGGSRPLSSHNHDLVRTSTESLTAETTKLSIKSRVSLGSDSLLAAPSKRQISGSTKMHNTTKRAPAIGKHKQYPSALSPSEMADKPTTPPNQRKSRTFSGDSSAVATSPSLTQMGDYHSPTDRSPHWSLKETYNSNSRGSEDDYSSFSFTGDENAVPSAATSVDPLEGYGDGETSDDEARKVGHVNEVNLGAEKQSLFESMKAVLAGKSDPSITFSEEQALEFFKLEFEMNTAIFDDVPKGTRGLPLPEWIPLILEALVKKKIEVTVP